MSTTRRYRIAVENLRQHMFVAELDRPWLDTPFLLQGFLVDSKVELDTLIKYCDYVYVDLELSSPEVADIIKRAEIRGPDLEPETLPMETQPSVDTTFTPDSITIILGSDDGTDDGADDDEPETGTAAPAVVTTILSTVADVPRRSHKRRADDRTRQLTRRRFRNFVRQSADARKDDDETFIGRWFGWLLRLLDRNPGSARNTTPTAASGLLPEGIQATQYDERQSMLAELPRARQAFSRGEAALAEVMGNIRSGKVPQLETVEGAVDGMVESMLDNPDALMWIARLREEDINTYNHGIKVALYLVALGRHLGLPKRELGYLGQIGMLADIGKTRLPRALLEKPGMLSPAEFDMVKEHVSLTLDLLDKGPKMPDEVTTGIAQHHERVDGSGYPKGLKGNEIGFYGKMTAIADSFAALITPRAYANAWAPQDALMNLYEWSGTSFHEPMVEQFVQAIGVFPVGSMIELTTGEVGVVVAHNRIRRLEPKVLILSNADKSPLAQPVERDLFEEGKVKGTKSLRITRGHPAGAFGFKLRDYYLDEIARKNGIIS